MSNPIPQEGEREAADAARRAYFAEGRHGHVDFSSLVAAVQETWIAVARAVFAALPTERTAQPAPVAYWHPKGEQFCIAPKDGSRPFAKVWEPLYAAPTPANVSDSGALLQILSDVEWCQPISNSSPSCPCCGAMQHWGHREDCELAAALASTTREGKQS